MKPGMPLFSHLKIYFSLLLAIIAGCALSAAQQPTPESADKALAESVQELRAQVQELRAAVAEIKSEASQYRAESQELRKELDGIRAASTGPSGTPSPSPQGPAPASSIEQRISAIEENAQLVQSQVKTQYQSKIESASKYRVRLSGLVLLNMFSNHGSLDNSDFPTYAAPIDTYGTRSSFGATLR